MSIRIHVIGSDRRPAEGIEVHVSWKSSGSSHGRTDSSGVFDTRVSGPAGVSHLTINGKEVVSNIILEDRSYTYQRPY